MKKMIQKIIFEINKYFAVSGPENVLSRNNYRVVLASSIRHCYLLYNWYENGKKWYAKMFNKENLYIKFLSYHISAKKIGIYYNV